MALATRRAALIGAATVLVAPALQAQSRGTLRVGLGPQQPTQADTRRVWEPLYRRVAERMGLTLSINVANDWAGISTAIVNEQIDVAQGPICATSICSFTMAVEMPAQSLATLIDRVSPMRSATRR